MRTPTPHAVLYHWHSEALKGVLGDAESPHPDEPKCGWFKRTFVRGGVFVPARIWMFQDVDEETGLLLSDEEFQCEVAGGKADPFEQWSWLCRNPISEAEYRFLEAAGSWSRENAPGEPMANPRNAVDWLAVPTPEF